MADINKLNGYDIRDSRYDNIATAIDAINDNIENLTNNKQNNITGGATTITEANLQTNRALVSNAVGKVDVSPVTSTELGYINGVTNNVQTQLNGKQATVTGGASTVTSNNLTANRALISNANGKIAVSLVTSTELGYIDGVTSNVQTQLNNINTNFNTLNNNALKKRVKDLGSLYVMTASDFEGYGFFSVTSFSPSSSPEVNSAGNDKGDWWLLKTYNGSKDFATIMAFSGRSDNIYYGRFISGGWNGWKKIQIAEEKIYSQVRYASKTIAAGAKGSYSLKDLGFVASDIPAGYKVVGYERIFASSDKLALSGFIVTENINVTNTISYINPTNASVTSNIGACLILEKKI